MRFFHELTAACIGADYSSRPPFSFVYGGRPSADLTANWRLHVETGSPGPGRERETTILTDPDTGLEVRIEATRFDGVNALEWVLRFTNTGAANTPILERILPLDLNLTVPSGQIVLHHSHGSTCEATDFLPIDEELCANGRIEMIPRGGRSSDGAMPFFNLQYAGGGLAGAIGWSGQWSMNASRDAQTGVALTAGQQRVRLTLYPGEEIRSPRILLIGWSGSDMYLGHNLMRRLLLEHYVPRFEGEIATAPIAANSWFTFNQGNEVTQSNQIALIPDLVNAGVEYYWLDAGWFEGGWPGGAGSWIPKKDAFPNGLRPVADAAHRAGMKFVLWFEPERVMPQSAIGSEHPEWCLSFKDETGADFPQWLFNLGNSDARKWLTDMLARCLCDWDVDVFRNDFNIGPLAFWRAADAPDREGIAEIRYIEGLYEMWDELLRRKPGLTIDNCASGGRRIDLETISRSYPLWQSDTQCCGHDMPIWNQVQNAGLSLYVPQHTAGAWLFDHYNIRSVATMGYSLCSDLSKSPDLIALARKASDEVHALRPYYLGDYYPLLPISLDPSVWCGWQYHRPDLRGGFAMLFRRDRSPYPSASICLHGLIESARYTLTDIDTGRTWQQSGSEIMGGMVVAIGEQGATMVVRYDEVC